MLDTARRRRIALAVEISLVVLYVLLRTVDAGRPVLTLWLVAVLLVAVVSPVSGLVLLAAIAPFSEPLTITRQLGVKPLIVVALAGGVVVRILAEVAGRIAERRRRGRSAAAAVPIVGPLDRAQVLAVLTLGAAAIVLVGTALGVAESRVAFGKAFGQVAAETWLAGIGGGLIVLVVATWVGARGAVRPVRVAVGSAVVGGVVSLLDYANADAVRGQALEWLLRPGRFEGRLTGIIPSPNGVAAALIVPAAVLVAVAFLGRDWRVRIVAAVAAVPLVVALYVTYSRAALIGLFLIAVVVAWRVRRAAGIALLVAGIAAGAVLLPRYLQARSDAIGGGSGSEVKPGDRRVASDALRLAAWQAAGSMWIDDPLTGHGFMSYQALHETYGDPILRSPHNEWLRLFAEEGIVVGVAGIAFVALAAAALTRGPGALGAGALGGFLGLVVAATFNNPFLFVQVLAISMTIVGIGLGRAIRDDSSGREGASSG
jgi:O-antigen ligase/polysaccharide polymerase Wzy-like membrane protein